MRGENAKRFRRGRFDAVIMVELLFNTFFYFNVWNVRFVENIITFFVIVCIINYMILLKPFYMLLYAITFSYTRFEY